jgi:hypothetical protein
VKKPINFRIMNFEPLQTFRQEIHQLLTKAKDATFELMDAVMTTRHASSLAEFSLSPMFRRRYPSTYEALEDSRPPRNQSMLALLIDIGTPAEPPKSRGKSSGRAKGFKCTPRTRYSVARKTYSRPKKPNEDKNVVVA